MEYKGEVYTRYTNPPEDKETLIRWKIGNIKVYDMFSDGKTWIEWRWTGRWMNKLQWNHCEEPEIEKLYQQSK